MDVNQYTTVSEALQDLNRRGFAGSFTVERDGLRSTATGRLVRPEDATIVEYHRFEGDSNADDMSVVYALECSDGTRGVIVDAYGMYADPLLGDFLKNVKLKQGL